MPRTSLGLVLSGCAAAAIGVAGGWTAMALRAPAPAPAELASIEAPAPRAPAPVAADEMARPATKSAPPVVAEKAGPLPQRTAAASGPTGVWIDHTGRGAVEIKDCAGGLCGRIVWLKDAANSSVCGTQVIGSAKKTAPDTWDNGWIYDPDKNARYSVELKTMGADKLRVMGYMGSKMFSETYTWKRAGSDLRRCDAPVAAATPAPAGSDPKPAPTEVTKTDPATEPAAETPPPGKAAKPGMGDLEKIAREMLKTKPGGKQCTVNLPYVGNVKVPCSG
jgi:uncharacterized protein (DUF2147 family)